MYIIDAINANEALSQGLDLIEREGVPLNSRNGMTLELPAPVATVYRNPRQRVLVSSARDANPFFHLMEALWIIAGRSDVKFLTEFNKRMAEFSDDGIEFNAPYGCRLRMHFLDSGNCDLDQIEEVINILKRDPTSRQAVCQIWDTMDIDRKTKDKACNMSLVFRIRNHKLDMVVYNRSNDMIWGAYGANIVQFSMLQEYVAAHVGIQPGTYTQVSNSFHVYTEGPGGEAFRRLMEGYDRQYNPYDFVEQTVNMSHLGMHSFDYDLKQFFKIYDRYNLAEVGEMVDWKSEYFKRLVLPMLCTYLVHKKHGPVEAAKTLEYIEADDWRMAAADWLQIRAEKRAAK